MEEVLNYLIDHPLYIPFLLFNLFVIYKIVSLVFNGDDDDDKDDDEGLYSQEPDLDLPPGVSLPVDSDLVEA
ncbi:MAG: hypothetical protein MK086_05480 [Flavobacteriales bacterium]|nr:hypothetical protein [Flavobacteriales bacterium]